MVEISATIAMLILSEIAIFQLIVATYALAMLWLWVFVKEEEFELLERLFVKECSQNKTVQNYKFAKTPYCMGFGFWGKASIDNMQLS